MISRAPRIRPSNTAFRPKHRASTLNKLGFLFMLLVLSNSWFHILEIDKHMTNKYCTHRPTWNFQYTHTLQTKKQTPWSESACELYQPNDRRLSAKWLPTFADTGCHVVSMMDPYGRFLDFLDRSRYFLSSSSSVVLTRLSGPRSRPTTFFFW
jgi:hypothetical protein